MAIDPTGGNGVNGYDALRAPLGKSRDSKVAPANDDSAAARSTSDSVQLSATSRTLVESTGSVSDVRAAGASGLSATRLNSTLQRLQTGYYDQSHVRDTIATRASADLNAE